MDDFVDAYAVLGVPPGATQEELKAAHRALVRRHHPDVVPAAQREAATSRMREVNVAYGLVRSREARARYDRLRHLHAARQAARAAAGGLRPAGGLSYRAGRLLGRWLAEEPGVGGRRIRSGTGRRSRR